MLRSVRQSIHQRIILALSSKNSDSGCLTESIVLEVPKLDLAPQVGSDASPY